MSNIVTYLGQTYNDVKISRGTITTEMSLPISSLGIDTLEIELRSTTDLTDFEQNTPVIYFHNGKQIGVFFVQNVTRIGVDQYEINAFSSVGRLDQILHYGGIYTGQKALEVIADICGDIPFVVKTNIADIPIYGWLPIATSRANLAQVLFAISANLNTDNNGVLRIETLWPGTSSYLDSDSLYFGGDVEYSPKITSVTVIEHRFVQSNDNVIETIYDGEATQGQRITFSDPFYDLSADGFSIISSGANWAVLSAGHGVLTGKKFTHATREVTQTLTSVPVINEKRIEDATLVSSANSGLIVRRLANYYMANEKIKIDAVIAQEKSGQIIDIYHPFNRQMVSACISTESLNMSGVLAGEIQALVDFLPASVGEIGNYDTVEILSGSGTWIVPDGVSRLYITIIGGGTGGSVGVDGTSATPPPISTSTTTLPTVTVYAKGIQGASVPPLAGGISGAPGLGGNIYTIIIDVEQGQSFIYSCGVGGAGEIRGGNAATVGTASTFGEYSSDLGGPISDGYFESITGAIYGATGANGYAGAEGQGMVLDSDGSTYIYSNPSSILTSDGEFVAGMRSEQEIIKGTYGAMHAGTHGGMGGGAAYGANGADGQSNAYAVVSTGSTTASNYSIATPGDGGNGADALPPPKAAYGTGGTGGNGGGGAGQFGWNCFAHSINTAYSYNVTFNGTDTRARGGYGSDGGEAGDGCVIIGYKNPIIENSGLLVDSKLNFFTDSTGRFVIT